MYNFVLVGDKVEEETTTAQISKRGNLYSKFSLFEVLVKNVHKMERRWSSVAAAKEDNDESMPPLEKGGSGITAAAAAATHERKHERGGGSLAPPYHNPPSALVRPRFKGSGGEQRGSVTLPPMAAYQGSFDPWTGTRC
ncbi:hypothetical protein Scep_030550 [Stephania cephalantha]|uniref:Uncharacterized protein n=1 Tax=Stephania cephalantha TaxID=152367 RepID=A0AAP0DZU4_9MAGN